jgi:hypothetical protein
MDFSVGIYYHSGKIYRRTALIQLLERGPSSQESGSFQMVKGACYV